MARATSFGDKIECKGILSTISFLFSAESTFLSIGVSVMDGNTELINLLVKYYLDNKDELPSRVKQYIIINDIIKQLNILIIEYIL